MRSDPIHANNLPSLTLGSTVINLKLLFPKTLLLLLILLTSSELAANESNAFNLTSAHIDQLKNAVKENDIAATHMLGILYITGQGVEKNTEHGTALIQRAADRGFASSQLAIAVMYNTGHSVYKKNRARSLAWAMMAKSQGLIEAEDYYQYLANKASPDELRNSIEIYKKLAATD